MKALDPDKLDRGGHNEQVEVPRRSFPSSKDRCMLRPREQVLVCKLRKGRTRGRNHDDGGEPELDDEHGDRVQVRVHGVEGVRDYVHERVHLCDGDPVACVVLPKRDPRHHRMPH